jgi:hypothetical protein
MKDVFNVSWFLFFEENIERFVKGYEMKKSMRTPKSAVKKIVKCV